MNNPCRRWTVHRCHEGLAREQAMMMCKQGLSAAVMAMASSRAAWPAGAMRRCAFSTVVAGACWNMRSHLLLCVEPKAWG